MNTPFVDLKECRVQQARAFARQFNKFEWKDLCSYQGFLTLMDHGLDTGDFFPAQIRAEETLVKDRLRKQTRTAHIRVPNYSPGRCGRSNSDE
jgi:hypothetical protein